MELGTPNQIYFTLEAEIIAHESLVKQERERENKDFEIQIWS